MVVGNSRTGAFGDTGASKERYGWDDMFRIGRTVEVLLFVVLALTHVVDVTVQVLSEMCCILLLCRI